MGLSLTLSDFCKLQYATFLCAGFPPPDILVSSGWELCHRLPKQSPHCKLLATRLVFFCLYFILCKLILRLAGIYGFPKAALSLNNFSHPCNRWLRFLTMFFPGRIYIALSSWHYGDFRHTFLPNLREGQKKKKIYHLSAGHWHCAIWQIRSRLLHYRYVRKKFR